MRNVVRKALRVEINRIIELRDTLTPYSSEWKLLNEGAICLAEADILEFHNNPSKCYREPKSNFVFKNA